MVGSRPRSSVIAAGVRKESGSNTATIATRSNAAPWGISFVVEFDRVAIVAVFDPDSFLTPAAITDDLGRDPTMDLVILSEFLAQKTHDLRTAEAGHGVLQP